MLSIKRTDEFNDRLSGIRDGMTQRRLVKRLRKAALGNLGDVTPVGNGGV
jgi:putative component of toxin-antitoxin plasmid stabilization module